MERQIYQARWVFPVAGPPLADAIIEIEGARIAAVYAGDHPAAIDLGNVALIPGLVNAHTHLEFSQLSAPLKPAAPFTDWIRAIMKSRFETEQPVSERIQQGIVECMSAGTTSVGEIATSEESLRLFNADSEVPRAVVFRECLGFTPDRMAGQEQVAAEFLAEPIRSEAAERLCPGLSPHAPYSVHPDLYLKLVQQARDQGVPVAVHLGETRAEYDLLERKEGAFVDLLSELGLWDPGILKDGMWMIDYLAPLAELPSALAVHGNYFGPTECEFLRGAPSISVVYCPRTHRYFGHPEHPWLTMIEQGINVALGTDSRASNPDLSLWKELQFLHEICPRVATELILECGTLAGARALGFAEEAGSLEVGKAADLAMIQLPDEAHGGAGSDLLLDSRSYVARVMLNGRWIN